MKRALILLLVVPMLAMAEPRPPTGLLSKDGPLPATIPFHLRAPDDRDVAAILSDASGRRVISGYVRAGTALRLLVPPGNHRLTLAAGVSADWQGPQDLFGDQGTTVTLPDPLDFRITPDSRREGHALTTTFTNGALRIADRQDRTLCQIAEWDLDTVTETTPAGTELRWLDPQLTTRSRPCD
ncbi:hypothetical protein [Paracoccus sp. (in: a-proteobacteria)]|uniref:hypothetical protein n=1 Tax=Paracoccus sp. TaxID=267 RepID=UPI00396C9D0B